MSLVVRLALPLLVLVFTRPAWLVMVGAQKKLSRRGDIAADLMVLERERSQLLNSIPCFVGFLRKYTDNSAWTSLMILDDGEMARDIDSALVTSLHDRFAFYRRAAAESPGEETFQPASNAIVLMPNGSSLEHGYYILDPCGRGCPFIAILITPFDDEHRFLEQADTVARSMWSRRISTFVILARVGDSVLAAGSLTFQPDTPCAPSAPVILDECGRGKSWGKLERIKAPAVNGCVLKVVYFEEPPYVITVNDSERLSGFEGGLAEEVMKGQNAERTRVEWKDNTTYAEQTEMLLYNEMADLVIGRILQQSHGDIGYSTSYDMLKVVWVIPKVANVSLKGLVQPFHSYVWAAIAATLFLAALIRILVRDDLSWLDTFGLIIGEAVPRAPSRLSGKIRYISWTIFGIFLAQLYVDSLSDQLINVSDMKIQTAAELMASSFQIGGTAAIAGIFNDFQQADHLFSLILERYVVFDQDDYAKQFDDLLDGRNASFALVAVLNSSRSAAIETAYAYTMTTEIICSFPLALASWKGFPYLRYIDGKIQDYIDTGIFDFMVQLALANETRRMLFQAAQVEEYKSNLHLQQFVPAFLLIVIGCASGLIFLVLEIALYPSRLLRQSPTR